MASLWSHHPSLTNNDANSSETMKVLNSLKRDSDTSKASSNANVLNRYYQLVQGIKQVNEILHELGIACEFANELRFFNDSIQHLYEINNRIFIEIEKEEHRDIMTYFRQYLETLKRDK